MDVDDPAWWRREKERGNRNQPNIKNSDASGGTVGNKEENQSEDKVNKKGRLKENNLDVHNPAW